MTLQFIHDKQGNTTGVYIPIEEWRKLKSKYSDLQDEESKDISELSSWQENILNERLEDYYKNPNDVVDFDTTLDKIRKGI
ncbi:hypothetical protein [Flavobacterium sp. 7A]|uniref:hypothetical protein n=1 Tax=Flavobacterium sp. 7A TaxID=2940571 RepID=UPI0022262094|nr:hypothetical protein [Flavobacterium sp. 7A]MCW2120608.1 hypothetical protein [Flavobacterium sp. 7A]